MTPYEKYQVILHDILLLLHERAARYFMTRYQGEESADLKVQCDTLTVLLEQDLKPHTAWFAQQERETAQLLTLDLDEAVLAEGASNDAHD